ncbi:CENP-B protein, partial [Lophiostoma macrostomum CBS 122681]
IGLAWLETVFNRLTKEKARQLYRLLIVDGYGSHLTMDFIDYCNRNRILLAIYLPYTIYTLQPLDISIFKPLLIAYLNKLVLLIYSSRGLRLITLRDFFSMFYKAWSNTIRPKLILGAFEATGIWLLNPARILDRFN